MPLDEFARKILTARGGGVDDPASVYFAISKDTNDTVERVTQVFCGVRMLVRRCHTHPLENWTQARLLRPGQLLQPGQRRGRTAASQRAEREDGAAQPAAAGCAVNPRTGRAAAAEVSRRRRSRDLAAGGGSARGLRRLADRRRRTRSSPAAWSTAYWSYFFHRGIIEPVDDIRSTNPPINPALLDALTKDFVDHKFDVRHLMRRIVTSATYQRSSVPNDSNRHDELNFSHAIPRRVPAEALLDSLVQATGVPENFGGAPPASGPPSCPTATSRTPFLKLFGKPQRMEACECERDNGSNMLQALHFINGKSILSRVQNPNGRPAQLLKQKLTDKATRDRALSMVARRRPTPRELDLAAAFFTTHKDSPRRGRPGCVLGLAK